MFISEPRLSRGSFFAVHYLLVTTEEDMDVLLKLTSYHPNDSGVMEAVGYADNALAVDSFEAAEEEAREWIRKNRLINSEHPCMRFKVEILDENQQHLTQYDETAGDPVLTPTDETCISCSC